MVNIVLPGLYPMFPVDAGGDAVTAPSSMLVFKGPYGAVKTESSGKKAEVVLLAASATVCDDPTVCDGVSVSIIDNVAVGMSGNVDEFDEE